MKRVRKPGSFMVKGELGHKIELAWCYTDEGGRFCDTEFVMELTAHDAVRFAAWLRKAILWLEVEK